MQDGSILQTMFQLLPMLLVIALAGFVIYSIQKSAKALETPATGITPGIKGWLILLALGVGLAPVRLLMDLVPYYAMPGMADAFARFPFVMRCEALLNASLLAATCVTFYHFVRKHRAFRTAFYVQYGLGVATFPLIIAISHASLVSEGGGFASVLEDGMVEVTRWLLLTVVGGIWAAYVAKSRRVAITFVK